MRSKRVLGVDPGFDRIGLAILDWVGGKEVLLYSECLETDKKSPREKRLFTIGERVKEIIQKWQPRELAIEKLFFNQNITSALGVAEARGVILYEAECAGLLSYEYGPQAVKIAVTGYGKASKPQVEAMAQKLLGLKETSKKLDDELDAIALCITHLASHRSI